MTYSRRNVTNLAIFRYLVVFIVEEQFVQRPKFVVITDRGWFSVQCLTRRQNRDVGSCQLRSRRFSAGSKQAILLNGQRFAVGDRDYHPTWLAMCTRILGSRYAQPFHVEVTHFPFCTIKYRHTDMQPVRCKERPLTSLAPSDGLRANL